MISRCWRYDVSIFDLTAADRVVSKVRRETKASASDFATRAVIADDDTGLMEMLRELV
jgi:hypothetical protein